MNINKSDYPILYKEVTALYEKSCDDNLEDFPLSEREKFLRNGNRQDFEKLYFKRRDYLSSAAILSLFDNSYINELEKIILAICDETSWMLPAHIIHGEEFVDLFIAETAFALAEISSVFAARLSSEVHGRVKDEIRKRLIERYRNNTYWWENCNMNWASVCGAYIGGTLLYLFPEEFKNQKSRILKTLDSYTKGFTDDGFCPEGPSYWQYGFMAYTVFADLLYRFSQGKEDLFASEKIKNIASYGGKCLLKGKTSLSFSDSQRDFLPDFALQKYLYAKSPDSVPYIENESLCLYDANTKWMNYYRAIIWNITSECPLKKLSQNVFSAKADVLIVNKSAYSFAFKGGHNGEPHNHNDLGSFIYSDKDGPVFCDLGSGRYTKDYFDEEKRYDIFCNSSFSHSVPIINSKGQSAGKEWKASLSFENDTAICDITKAYCENRLNAAIRTAEIKENGIIITDNFNFSGNLSVTERFVSLRKAEIKDGMLIFGATKLKYQADKVTLCVKEEYHTPHEYDAEDLTVYCYDFILYEGVNETTFEITTE